MGESNGNWRYEALGFADITHIRFLPTGKWSVFSRTGYRLARNTYGIDSRLRELFWISTGSLPATIDIGKMVLRDITSEELHELCSRLQFYVVAVPAESDSQYASETDAVLRRNRRHLHLLEQHLAQFRAEVLQFEQRMAVCGRCIRCFTSPSLSRPPLYRVWGNCSVAGRSGLPSGTDQHPVADAPPADFVDNERIEWRQQVSGPVLLR